MSLKATNAVCGLLVILNVLSFTLIGHKYLVAKFCFHDVCGKTVIPYSLPLPQKWGDVTNVVQDAVILMRSIKNAVTHIALLVYRRKDCNLQTVKQILFSVVKFT